MHPRKILINLCVSVPLFLGVTVANAADAVAPQNPTASVTSHTIASIPYRQEPKSFAEQSLSTFFITLLLLGGTAAGLYYLRNYLQKKTGNTFIKSSSITIKERVRLSPKLSMYVVTYRDKEILVAQIGDTVTPLSEFPIPAASATPGTHSIQDQPEPHAHT